MKEIRLNLTAAEIRAYQAGDRVLRRRVKPMKSQQWLKPETLTASPGGHGCMIDGEFWWQFYHPLAGKFAYGVQNEPDSPLTCIRSPFGSPGDRLVLREAWRTGSNLDKWSPLVIQEQAQECGFYQAGSINPCCPLRYEADGLHREWSDTDWRDFGDPGKLRQAGHMPRWAARYTPSVRTVRVEQIDGVWWWVAEVEG